LKNCNYKVGERKGEKREGDRKDREKRRFRKIGCKE
jgi:hypothetical protein